MSLAEHIKDHLALGMDFRFPADGNTYFLFSSTSVKFYVNGVLVGQINADGNLYIKGSVREESV